MDGLYITTDIPVSQECRLKRFWFFHHDIRAFTTSWLPQPVFLIWRVFAALYLLAWMIADIVLSAEERWPIYFTSLAFLLLVVTYIMLAVITLLYTIQKCCSTGSYADEVNLVCCSKSPGEYDAPPEVYDHDYISFMVKIIWFLWINCISAYPGAVIGFYVRFLETSEGGNNATANHIQGINLTIIVIDVFLSRMPVHLLHFPWAGVFNVSYVVFTGVYHAIANSADQDGSGVQYIYQELNYSNQSNGSVGWALLLGLHAFIVHFMWWIVIFLRDLLYKACTSCCYHDISKSSKVV